MTLADERRPDVVERGNPDRRAAWSYFYHCHVSTPLRIQPPRGEPAPTRPKDPTSNPALRLTLPLLNRTRRWWGVRELTSPWASTPGACRCASPGRQRPRPELLHGSVHRGAA